MNEKILIFFLFCFRMISIWRIQTDHIQKRIRNISPCRGSVSFYSVLWNWNMFDCSRKSISWIQQRSPNRRQQQNDPNDLNGLKNWESHHQTKRKTHSLPPPPPSSCRFIWAVCHSIFDMFLFSILKRLSWIKCEQNKRCKYEATYSFILNHCWLN